MANPIRRVGTYDPSTRRLTLFRSSDGAAYQFDTPAGFAITGLAPDFGPLTARLDAIVASVRAIPAPSGQSAPPVDLAPVLTRLDALAAKEAPAPVDPTPALDAVGKRLDGLVAALQAVPAPPTPQPVDLGPVLLRQDSLGTQMHELTVAVRAVSAALQPAPTPVPTPTPPPPKPPAPAPGTGDVLIMFATSTPVLANVVLSSVDAVLAEIAGGAKGRLIGTAGDVRHDIGPLEELTGVWSVPEAATV